MKKHNTKKSWVCFTSVFDHLYNNPRCIQLQLGESESDPYWSKYSEKKEMKGEKNPADIFIYERAEVWRGSKKKKNVGWIYLLNKGQQNTTTKPRRKTFRIQDISVRRDEKMFSEEKCPCGRQMPKQLWQRKKGGKYERTEGTTIIYVNNVPLLLIISGKIKQKRAGGGDGGFGEGGDAGLRITHVTQLIFLMQINNRNYKWKLCCCDGEGGREREREMPPLFFFTLFGIH